MTEKEREMMREKALMDIDAIRRTIRFFIVEARLSMYLARNTESVKDDTFELFAEPLPALVTMLGIIALWVDRQPEDFVTELEANTFSETFSAVRKLNERTNQKDIAELAWPIRSRLEGEMWDDEV